MTNQDPPQIKRAEGISVSFYIPEKFKNDWLKFQANCTRDPVADKQKLQNKDGKCSIVIRELMQKYNSIMEAKYGALIPPEQEAPK